MTLTGALALICGLSALAALVAIAMMYVFAQLIGWRSLVRRYGAVASGGRRYPSKGVVLGANSWNAPPLFVRLDEFGITFVPRSPFRFAFAPFRIPWPLVRSFEARKYVLFEVVVLRFGTDPPSQIGFAPSKATEAIAARLAGERAHSPASD